MRTVRIADAKRASKTGRRFVSELLFITWRSGASRRRYLVLVNSRIITQTGSPRIICNDCAGLSDYKVRPSFRAHVLILEPKQNFPPGDLRKVSQVLAEKRATHSRFAAMGPPIQAKDSPVSRKRRGMNVAL